MEELVEQIYDDFEGKLIGSKKMKFYVCEVLSRMPEKIVGRLTQTCWFMSAMEDAWAYAFNGKDLKNQHLIFLSDELLGQDEDQIRYTIAHEIGHIVLKHENSVLRVQTKAEIKKQEKEADEFARQYI